MTDKVSVSLTSMTLVYHYISFNFLGFITVLRNDEASEDFRGGNLESPKKYEVIEVTRGARWLEVLDERFARRKGCEFGILSCLVIGKRHRWTPSLLPQVQGELMESESPDTKKVWKHTKNHEGKIFWSKKARFECVKIVLQPGSRISEKNH